jgi:transcriptional regulator with XRE-family HTH domain
MNVSNASIVNVKQLRESRNLSIRSVAIAVDVAESTVYRWESGTVKPQLPLEKVKVMLDLLECDFITLYEAFQQTAREAELNKSQGEEKSLTAA